MIVPYAARYGGVRHATSVGSDVSGPETPSPPPFEGEEKGRLRTSDTRRYSPPRFLRHPVVSNCKRRFSMSAARIVTRPMGGGSTVERRIIPVPAKDSRPLVLVRASDDESNFTSTFKSILSVKSFQIISHTRSSFRFPDVHIPPQIGRAHV